MGHREFHALVAAVLLLAIGGCRSSPAPDAVLSTSSLEVRFNGKSGTFEVADQKAGLVLTDGVIRMKVAGRQIASTDPGLAFQIPESGNRKELVFRFWPDALVRIQIVSDSRIEMRTEGRIEGPATFTARGAMGADGRLAITKADRQADRNVLFTVLGPAQVSSARSLFDPSRDLALTAGSGGQCTWHAAEGWRLCASAASGELLASLEIHRNYYRDTLGIGYYTPMHKLTRWPTAPIVAMTWYGIEGWSGRPAQRKEWLYPQIDWVAEHLLPYAGPNLIFQFDDNYPLDDRSMRDLSDYVRSKGLVPGIWFTPFLVAPKDVAKQHPDWFIHDADGKTISTFGGVTYGGADQKDAATLNVTSAAAVENWYGMWWKKASETWNFEFFKIDGQPDVVNAYKKARDGGGIEGYRKGLEIARSIVGPAKFINGCWGIPLEAIGLVDGSRTGGDTGLDPHAMREVVRWNFLNNVAWWCDPDAAANLYKAPLEVVRLNAQARVLTGQQFLTDDIWVKVPSDVRRIWQLSFPMLDIRPVNLYEIADWQKYDLFDLRIARPWGTWDVVGLFNYGNQQTEKVLDLGRLALDGGDVHVFDYWQSTYLGKFAHNAKIARTLAPYEGQLFAVVPAVDDRPVLISTSRHLSQGGLDLEQVKWEREGGRWTVSGTSSHLVKGDPYELVFAGCRYDVAMASSPAGPVKIARGGGVTRVQLAPVQSGSAQWTISFEANSAARVDLLPASLGLSPGSVGELDIHSLGAKPVKFEASASDGRIRLSPVNGKLAGWPATAKLQVSVDRGDAEPGTSWSGHVKLEAEGQAPQQARVTVRQPLPENLAVRAKATASSIWNDNHQARFINDGDGSTRWNSRQGQKENCWVELTWEQEVEFDRVVMDECTDSGSRIGPWRLEAGGDGLEVIARGDGAGRNRLVKLEKPVRAKNLRLVIEKATETPTIWELQVFRWAKSNRNP